MKKDRRNSFRFKVKKEQVQVKNMPDCLGEFVRDISASGASIFTSSGRIFDLQKSRIVLKLADYPSLETRFSPIWMEEDGRIVRAGFKFKEMDQEALGILSRFLADRFLEESRFFTNGNPEKTISIKKSNARIVRELIRYHCLFRHQPIQIYSEDSRPPATLQVKELTRDEDKHLIKISVSDGQLDNIEAGKEYTFFFPGSNAANYFKTAVQRIGSSFLLIGLPSYIIQSGFRNSLRASQGDKHHINLIIKHPRLAGISLKKPVLEISASGFSFPFDPEKDLLFPGEFIAGVILNLPEGKVHIEGVVRSIHDHSGKLAYGFEILRFFDNKERETWMRHVLLATHRRLKIGESEDASTFWEVLKASNYIDKEVTPSLRPMLKKRFFKAWKIHPEHPQINRNLILFQNEEPVATVSMNLLYPKTSLGHHLSTDKRIRKGFFDVGRELMSGNLFLFQHLNTTEYFISYFYADKTYNNIMFRRFLRKYPIQDDFVYDRYHLYKCVLYPELKGLKIQRGDFVVIPGNISLNKMLSNYLEKNLPKVEFEAFSYNEDEITLEAFSKECLRYNYERKRQIFFVLEDEKPIAALIAETGDEGVNTFNLLNCCRVVYLTPEANGDDRVLLQLMGQAIRFYREEKKPEFIFFRDYEGKPKKNLDRYGIQYFTDGMRWLGRNTMLPAYLNYIEETLGMVYSSFKPY